MPSYDPTPFVIELSPCALPDTLQPSCDPLVTPEHQKAYELARQLEGTVAWPKQIDTPPSFTPTVGGRVLGLLMMETPGLEGVNAVTREIVHCKKDNDSFETTRALDSVANFYVVSVLKIFFKYSGPTPQVSEHPSRGSFEVQKHEIAREMQDDGNQDFRKIRKAALLRDGHRCMITRDLDSSYQKRSHLTYQETPCHKHVPHNTSQVGYWTCQCWQGRLVGNRLYYP